MSSWREADRVLAALLDNIGVTEDTRTVTIRCPPRTIESPQQFKDDLAPYIAGDEPWSLITTRRADGGDTQLGFAAPVAKGAPGDDAVLFLEVHSLFVAWWLVYAWRARQLARSALRLAEGGDAVAAAACARPLLETAAAAWVDSRKLRDTWDGIKRDGAPGELAVQRRIDMLDVLNQILWGAKFSDRVPDEQEVWGGIQRSNVLNQIAKLANVVHEPLLEADYAWLCNTVHPSLGNQMAFSAPPAAHPSGMYLVTMFTGRPLQIPGVADLGLGESTVHDATARAAGVALRVLAGTLDNALRVVDDLGLTTGAPSTSRYVYWRQFTPAGRNERCPCRSGKKAKRCSHEWGDGAPTIPQRFE